MDSLAGKIVAGVLSVFLLVYVGYQAFTALYNPYETEIVRQDTYVQDIDLNGFFVRNEKVLQTKKQGVIRYQYQNAEKISKSAVVANVYRQESDLYNLNKLAKLEKEKALLEESQDKQGVEGLKLDLLNTQVNENQAELIRQLDEGNLNDLDKTYESLVLNMNKVAVCLDYSLSFETAIQELEQQISQLKSKISQDISTISSEESGYFSNVVDGYEEIFTLDMLNHLTSQSVENYIANQKVMESDYIGRVQSDAGWSFVSLVPTAQVDLFDKGKTLKLKFNSKTTKEITVSVSQVIIEKNNENSVVVFESNILDGDFATMRFEKPKAILNRYNGILIPKEAIRFEKTMQTVIDEETQESKQIEKESKGVYTLLGKTVRFKPINVLYEDEYYVVAEISNNSNYVSIYDKVILKGKDLNGAKT